LTASPSPPPPLRPSPSAPPPAFLFVYESDLPEITPLETYRPNASPKILRDDGQLVAASPCSARILMTWEQIPKVLYNGRYRHRGPALRDHWGVDFPRVAGAAYRNSSSAARPKAPAPSPMQLARQSLLDRSDPASPQSPGNPPRTANLSAATPSRKSSPCTPTRSISLTAITVFAAASQFYFGKPVSDLPASRKPALLGGHDSRARLFAALVTPCALLPAATSSST